MNTHVQYLDIIIFKLIENNIKQKGRIRNGRKETRQNYRQNRKGI